MNLAASERFQVFCNTTAAEGELSFTFVCRQDFDDVFLGVTTRHHIDRKGSVVPCFGWKSNSCIYSAAEDAQDVAGGVHPHLSSTSSAGQHQDLPLPLWGKGDCVELVVSLAVASRGKQPSMVLKVNGRQLDRICNLPPLHSWSWYLAMYLGGDMSSVTFMQNSYAVYWGEYQVKRFLS